ncbi:MAG: N-6 DNA methylase [Phycisphaerales bacterium]|nr:N-6 DNA methylase [Phycisphaerales bacterium]
MEENAHVSSSAIQPRHLVQYLKRYGYSAGNVVEDYAFADGRVPVLAFANEPHDARSACIAVVPAQGDARAACSSVWRTGAPVVWVCDRGEIQWWKQSPTTPQFVDRFTASAADRYIRDRKNDFDPKRIYRAKTLGRVDTAQQLSFVDIGLMPLAEHDSGEALSKLMGGVITQIASTLREATDRRPTADLDVEEERKVYRAAFWLLGAKMLHDKRVENFKNLGVDKNDPTSDQIRAVFQRVAKHQADPDGLPPIGKGWTAALREAAKSIFGFGHLGAMSTESLAWMWERTLITDDVRDHLAVHSTPSYLVDYILWQLAPWIEKIPEKDRFVFEPACGHAAFLVGALRQLRFLYEGQTGDDWRTYRRTHLRGVEVDPFAVEIARLSLTLADIPNHNGWSITQNDMYASDVLAAEASKAMILLGNPPYRKFDAAEKRLYEKAGYPVRHSKAVEVLDRTVKYLPPGGVFGFVLPLGVLHSDEATEVRQTLTREFEVSEVCMFPDKVFAFAEPETVVLMGRRRTPSDGSRPKTRYRRVEEGAVDVFRQSYHTASSRDLPMSRFERTPQCIMLVPELDEVWTYLGAYEQLGSLASVAKGFEFEGRDLPTGARPVASRLRPGDVLGYKNVPKHMTIDGSPEEVSLTLKAEYIRRTGSGLTTGTPQLLVPTARVSRGRWRTKCVFDREGHPVSARFMTVRPSDKGVPLEFLWAVLNSPMANAFLSCREFTRDVLPQNLKRIPVPKLDPARIRRVVAAAKAYLDLPKAQTGWMQPEPDRSRIKAALMQMDAEVLSLYDLPPDLEANVVRWFQGEDRDGVHCSFSGYPSNWSSQTAVSDSSSGVKEPSIWDKFDEAIGSMSPETINALPTHDPEYDALRDADIPGNIA